MIEGWTSDDEYLILFDEAESVQMTEGYGVRQFISDMTVIGVIGWDDFILRDQAGNYFRVPTVPLVRQHVIAIAAMPNASNLTPDEKFTGTIKWYITPIVFGGDPSSHENVTWINVRMHQELVRWWNLKYKEVSAT